MLSLHPEAAAQRPSKDGLTKDEAEKAVTEMAKKFPDLGAKVYVEADKVKDAN